MLILKRYFSYQGREVVQEKNAAPAILLSKYMQEVFHCYIHPIFLVL